MLTGGGYDCCVSLTPTAPLSLHDSDRNVLVVRDPRNVVISEHRMRRKVFHQSLVELDAFVQARFEVS